MRNCLIGSLTFCFLCACSDVWTINEKSGLDYARKAVVEATISSVKRDIDAGRMSCVNVVNAYIERIEAYDQSSGMNAITYKNYEAARSQAARIDIALAVPIHERLADPTDFMPSACIPMLVKDNIDVKGFPTTAGSKLMLENFPPDDAQIITNLKKHGAIVLAKTNMAEWAFSPRRTKSTTAGITKNAYNFDHVPAGSSGGTASGVAASFALVGLGTDTGNSVRGPSSHLSLVGMRSTHGKLSLDGIVPLVLSADVVGPMTRSVADNQTMYQFMQKSWVQYPPLSDKNALKGKRVGVVRELSTDMDKDITNLYEVAINDLEAAGAIVVKNIKIKDIVAHIDAPWGCKSFRKDVHEYLTQSGMSPPITDPFQAYEKGIYSPYTKGSWQFFEGGAIDVATKSDGSICGDLSKSEMRQTIKKDILDAVKREHLDALIYPSWRYPAARLDRAEEDYKGDNSQALAPPTGLPAITVPMGFAAGDLPAGLQFLGRENAENTLYALAQAYEKQTKHRRAPSGFPVIEK